MEPWSQKCLSHAVVGYWCSSCWNCWQVQAKGFKTMQNPLKTAEKLSSFIRKVTIDRLHSLVCGQDSYWAAGCRVVGCPSGISKAERNIGLIQQKSSRNNRNRKETAKNGFVVVVFVVLVINWSSIGFGIGIGCRRWLEAVGASSFSFLVVLPVAGATLLLIQQQ